MAAEVSGTDAHDRMTFALGGDLLVNRLGYGNRQLTGPGIWGEPSDRPGALRLLRRAVELGVEFIDTADAYGPGVAEALTAEALYPYPNNLVIGTKAGMVRTGPGEWHPLGRPEYLRQQCELSLRHLRVERIDLYQLHRIDPLVAVEDQLGVLSELQKEGKIRHIGLSEVTIDEIVGAQKLITVVSVQNRFNLKDREADSVIDFCERENIAFIPWFPLAKGEFGGPRGVLDAVGRRVGATPAQVALAWLLARSPVLIPIPGTASIPHLEENLGASAVSLAQRDLSDLDRIGHIAT
jgi:pyridoxine 4-dehydrogenase